MSSALKTRIDFLPGLAFVVCAASGRVRSSRMKVYWSGAALALMADVTLRERSGGEESLDTVLKRFQECCLPSKDVWTGPEFFARLDTLTLELTATDPDFDDENPNRVTDHYGTVSGGYANQGGDGAGSLVDAGFSSVSGGSNNTASGYAAEVCEDGFRLELELTRHGETINQKPLGD